MANVELDLFRSVKKQSLGKGDNTKRRNVFLDREGEESLYPDYTGFTRKDGSFRAPDVTTSTREGKTFVEGVGDKSREGVSLTASAGGFGYGSWCYFILPEGTPVPAGLDIHHSPSKRFPGHYSLRCRSTMRQDTYEGALDNLARAAIARCVERGIDPLKFTD